MNNIITTYEHYKTIYTTRDITKADIVNICSSLTVEFKKNELGNHEFEPEPITQGGIIFKSFAYRPYKTMRFNGNTMWPWIDCEWTENDKTIVLVKQKSIGLFLKAFYDAPKWTPKEKDIFRRVLCNNGFTTNKKGLKITY